MTSVITCHIWDSIAAAAAVVKLINTGAVLYQD